MSRDATTLGRLEKTRNRSDPNHRSTLPGFIATKGHALMQLKNPEYLAARFSSPPKFLLDQWDMKRPRNRSNLASRRQDWITLTCKFFFFLLKPFSPRSVSRYRTFAILRSTSQVFDPCSLRRERGANGDLAGLGRSAASRPNPLAGRLQLRGPSSRRAGGIHPGARETAWRGQRRSDQRRPMGITSLAAPSGYCRMV